MDASLPADLAQLKARVDHWRKTRTARTPIPKDLSQAARGLLDRYEVGAVCRACRLHPTSLQMPGSSRAKPAAKSTLPTPAAFFSLSPPVPEAEPPISNRRPSQDGRLVLERQDGARMILVAPQLDAATLGALCSYFLRS